MSSGVRVTQEPFGLTQSGESVTKFQITNHQDARVDLINYGAAIVSIIMPDRDGHMDDIVLGYDDIDGNCIFPFVFSLFCFRCFGKEC